MAEPDTVAEGTIIDQPTRKVQVGSEYISGPFVAATLNPDTTTFHQIVNTSDKSTLDIGCGSEPRLSWKLGPSALWVGCDPEIKFEEGSTHVSVHKSKPVSTESKLVLFSSVAADVPEFKPDVISIIAPNPKDIDEEQILNTDLEKFLDPGKPQKIVVVLEKRSLEANAALESNKERIGTWMKEHGFKISPEDPIWDKFSLTSNYTIADSTRACYVRSPGKT